MSDDEASIDTVALLKIARWEPADDVDVRELDDAFLVYLELPYEATDDEVHAELERLVGDPLAQHEDGRGIFVFPDAADPDDAETYDEVLEATFPGGRFLDASVGENDMHDALQAMMGEAMNAMGLDGPEELARILGGDQDALLMAQIKMQRALEETMQAAVRAGASPPTDADHDEADEASAAEKPALGPKSGE